MFSKAEVGERVWHIRKGYGEICDVDNDSSFRINVQFKNGINIWFFKDGREYEGDIGPTLFWDEIKYEIPKKPFNLEDELRRLKVVKFKKDEKNYFLLWENEYEKIEYDYLYYQEYPLTIYFNKESIDNFMDNIKDKNITKEEFFKAYKNAFGGE